MHAALGCSPPTNLGVLIQIQPSSSIRGVLARRRVYLLTLNLILLIFKQILRYTRVKSPVKDRRLSSKRVWGKMAARMNKKSESDTDKSQLSKQDLRLLLVMCTEFVNLCAKLTGKIDPAAAAMLTYVRDDIVSENDLELQ
jgi:hypothetical protein